MEFQLPAETEKTYRVTFEHKGERKERDFKAETERALRKQFVAFLPSATILKVEEK
jgi:hypothetical protein